MTGDPTEGALLALAAKSGVDDALHPERPRRLEELTFDADRRRMATIHDHGDAGVWVAVKGALESIAPLVDAGAATAVLAAERRARELAADGYRVLALEERDLPTVPSPLEAVERDLRLLGLVAMADPPRPAAAPSIEAARLAGIRPVMITGDHPLTAGAIARRIGLLDGDSRVLTGAELAELDDPSFDALVDEVAVYARTSPEQKVRIVAALQGHGEVVAMTGDGVNDAPALKKADIGIAMGIRGTAVAKEAAEMVLEDDEFRTIVAAIAHGRAIFQNIRKFVVYLLSCNISEVLIVTLATVAGAPLPLLPLQILFLNLVTDVFPALALGVGPGSAKLMQDRPRPGDEPVLTRTHWLRIALHGAVISAAVLAAMAIAVMYLGFEIDRAVTVTFCTLAMAQLWHVFNMREDAMQFVRNEIAANTWIWVAIGICVALILMAVYAPLLRDLLQLVDPGAEGWLLIMLASLVPLILGPFVNHVAIRPAKD